MKCPKCNQEEWFYKVAYGYMVCPICRTLFREDGGELDSQIVKAIEEQYVKVEETKIRIVKELMDAPKVMPVHFNKELYVYTGKAIRLGKKKEEKL